MNDEFVVDNDDTEEVRLITKQYRFCLAAGTQSYKKQFNNSQGLDDNTSFDEGQTSLTMLAKPLKCHGIDMAATSARIVAEGAGPPPYAPDPPAHHRYLGSYVQRNSPLHRRPIHRDPSDGQVPRGLH
jgi:hypothetical protein